MARGLAQGHAVTAFMRDRFRFAAAVGAPASLAVVEGDARDAEALGRVAVMR